MAQWKFNSEEREALRGLTCEAQIIYLLELRVKMDYETGITGIKTITSYQAWRECIAYVPDSKSRDKPNPITRRYLEMRKAELIRHGLIKQIDAKANSCMIFELPLAAKGLVYQKFERAMNVQDERAEHSADERAEEKLKYAEITEDFKNERAEERAPERDLKNPMNVIPPVSGISNENNIINIDRAKLSTTPFDEFWALYDRRIDRSKCERMYQTLIKRHGAIIHTKIMSALAKQIEHRKTQKLQGSWVPEPKHPATWLRNECWNDELLETTDENSRLDALWAKVMVALTRGHMKDLLATADTPTRHAIIEIDRLGFRQSKTFEESKYKKLFMKFYYETAKQN